MENIFANNLRRLRQAKNLTQEQAAEALNVSAQSVSRWECGNTYPDVMLLPQIARLYSVTVDDLYRPHYVAYDNYAHRLGSIYEATRKTEDFMAADEEFRNLVRSGEATTEDLRMYGILHQYMMNSSREKALQLFDQVLEQGCKTDVLTYWRTKRQKIYLLSQIGQADQAIADQQMAVESNYQDVEEWLGLIDAYLCAECYEDARKWYQKAVRIFPSSAALCYYGGEVFRGLKKYDEAFEDGAKRCAMIRLTVMRNTRWDSVMRRWVNLKKHTMYGALWVINWKSADMILK